MLAAGTVIPLLSHCKIIGTTLLLRYSHIIIFQLPLCSYSGVQNIVIERVSESQFHSNTLHDHSAQCDFSAPSKKGGAR